jgi:hypothetical protein
LNIKALRTGAYRFKVKPSVGSLPAGSYYLIAKVGATGLVRVTTLVSTTKTVVN